MKIDNEIIISLKYLLYPTITTIQDLKLLTEFLDNNVNEIINLSIDKFQELQNVKEKVLKLVVARFKPLLKSEKEKITVPKDLVAAWLAETKEIVKSLFALELPIYAKAITIEWLSIYFLLITLYVVWKGGGPKILQQLIERGEFEEEAFNILLRAVDDKELYELLEKINMKELFDLALSIHAKALEKTLSYMDKKNRKELAERIRPLLEKGKTLSDTLGNILMGIDNYDRMNKKLVLLMLPTLFEALSRVVILKNDESKGEDIEKIVEMLKKGLNKIDIVEESVDLGEVLLQEVARIYALIEKNDIKGVLEVLRGVGNLYLKNALKIFGTTSMISLKVSPDIILLAIPLTPPPLSIHDRLSPRSTMLISQDALEEIANWNFEAKVMLRTSIIRKPEVFRILFEHARRDPLALIGIRLLMGEPVPFILETILPILEIEDISKINEERLRDIIKLLNHLMKDFVETCEYLEKNGWGKNEWLRNIFFYYIHRLLFFTAPRLTEKTRKVLASHGGQDFLVMYEKLSIKIESMYPKVEEKAREDVSELFV
ncbi:MAG: hypothetical protein ACTSX9_00650 [Candidatus Njordarchaeales archaeon]